MENQQAIRHAALLLASAAGRTVALLTDDVERVLPMPSLTPLPDAPRGVAGLLNLHGDVLAVVDLRWRLERAESDQTGYGSASAGQDQSTYNVPQPSHNLVIITA